MINGGDNVTDKERVITGLQDMLEILDGFDEQDFTLDERKELHGSVMSMIQDALDYMKAQESVFVNRKTFSPTCPICGNGVVSGAGFCWKCGQELRWE